MSRAKLEGGGSKICGEDSAGDGGRANVLDDVRGFKVAVR